MRRPIKRSVLCRPPWGPSFMTSVSPTHEGYPADLRALTSLRAFLAMGVVLLVAAGFVIMNFIVDLLYAVLDPRIRHGHA